MSSEDKSKLYTLLGYWIDHNSEHCEEFRQWVPKAKEMGEAQVALELLQAINEMDKAGVILAQARKRLEG